MASIEQPHGIDRDRYRVSESEREGAGSRKLRPLEKQKPKRKMIFVAPKAKMKTN